MAELPWVWRVGLAGEGKESRSAAWAGAAAALCSGVDRPIYPQSFPPDAALKHTIVDKARLLSEVPLLSGVPTEVLADLAALSEVESRPDGDVLFVEGDPADAFYVIIEGSVRASVGDSLVGRAGAGVEIGALAVLDERPRLFTATTETPAVVLRIDGEDFLYLLEQQPRLARGVIRHLASQMRSALGQAEADRSAAAT